MYNQYDLSEKNNTQQIINRATEKSAALFKYKNIFKKIYQILTICLTC